MRRVVVTVGRVSVTYAPSGTCGPQLLRFTVDGCAKEDGSGYDGNGVALVGQDAEDFGHALDAVRDLSRR